MSSGILENNKLCGERIYRSLKELRLQRHMVQESEYSYRIPVHATQTGVVLAPGENASACCLSSLNQFIENAEDFEAAITSGAHHPVTGPYRLSAHRSGADLIVHIDDVVPFYDRVWCITRSAGVFKDTFRSIGDTASERCFKLFSPNMRFPTEPVVGFISTEARQRTISSGRGGAHGGNLDLPCIKKSSGVILPASSRGACVWFGDIHFTQGWGEVAGVALECSGIVKFRLFSASLVKNTREPIVLVPVGFGEQYDIYFVGCRASFRRALAAAMRNACRFHSVWGAYGFVDAYRELGLRGNLVVGQAVGKTVSLAIQVRVDHLRPLFQEWPAYGEEECFAH